MRLRSRATEIPELVKRLGSSRQNLVDAARARLSIIGARAVEALIEANEGDNNRIRAHAMPLLALIQDPRGREPLMAMLLDRDARMREIAARCLARFPSTDSAAALERLLDKESMREVRVAVVHALVEQYASGHERAIRRVLAILLDGTEDSRLRLAAFALLPMLRSAHRRGILRRLKQDPVPEIAERASTLDEAGEPQASRETASLKGLVRDLASEDYAVWNEAVHRLASRGAASVEVLIAEMERRAHDPEYCTRAGMALKALGPRRARALGDALDRVEEPLPLQVLVDVTGALGDKSLIYRLKDLIDRMAQREAVPAQSNGFDPMQRVRAKAHLELARVGSRVAIQDLRQALANPDQRLEIEILAAVELIGKRDEISDLLRAYAREDRFMRDRIASVVRTIMRRERIRRNSAVRQALGPEQKRTLEAILTPVGSRPSKSTRRPRPPR